MLLYKVNVHNFTGSLGIIPTRECTHFLKIRFLAATGGSYSYYIHQGHKSDKERKIVRKDNFYTKVLIHVLKLGAIPRLPTLQKTF